MMGSFGTLELGVCKTIGACRTKASSVPEPWSVDDPFLLDAFEFVDVLVFDDVLEFVDVFRLVDVFPKAVLRCCAPGSCGPSSDSVKLSKTFLNRLDMDASESFVSNDVARETTGVLRAAGAGAETITAQPMQVRDHNHRCRLSAR